MIKELRDRPVGAAWDFAPRAFWLARAVAHTRIGAPWQVGAKDRRRGPLQRTPTIWPPPSPTRESQWPRRRSAGREPWRQGLRTSSDRRPARKRHWGSRAAGREDRR